jgi:hypothetical protein
MTLPVAARRRTVSGVLDYEYQRMTLPRGTSRNAAQRVLVEAAEREHWEVDRLRLFPDGTRKVVLRRRIIRVRSTLPPADSDAGSARS